MGVSNVVRVCCKPDKDFFRMWLDFLTPVHKMTYREKDAVAAILKRRYILGKVIHDDALLDKAVFSAGQKKEIAKDAGITEGYLKVLLCKLRAKGVIKGESINRLLLPKGVTEGSKSCSMLVYYDFDESTKEYL